MDDATAQEMLKQLGGHWAINEAGHLEILHAFDNFVDAMVQTVSAT